MILQKPEFLQILLLGLFAQMCHSVKTGSPDNVEEDSNCTRVLKDFAKTASSFTECTLINSRPITLCENCVEKFVLVVEKYKELTQSADNGTHCIDNYINLDRLQVVQTVYDSQYDLWNNAKCSECFETVNGTISPNKSQETIKFNKYYAKFINCVNGTDAKDTTLCPTCMNDYINLDHYYLSISNENERIGMCMDIVDLMNTTRSMWSLKCCKFRQHDETIFLISAGAVLVLTAAFYIVVQFCAAKKNPTIMQQTRFAESLNQLNSS